MSVKNRSLQLGITLLELMLAMVILASIVMYLSVHMKNQTQDRQLQQTSIEMQTILQAATSYYLFQQDQYNSTIATQNSASTSAGTNLVARLPGYPTNNADTNIRKSQQTFWPQNLSDLVSTGAQPLYLETRWQLCASWPHTSGTACQMDSGKAGYDINATAQYFGVSVTLPTAQLALKLLAKLPGGEIDSGNSNKVWSYIPRPTSHYNPPMMSQICKSPLCGNGEIVGARGWIASAGVINSYPGDPLLQSSPNTSTKDRIIILPNCPAGYEGHYITTYVAVQTGNCVDYSNYSAGYITALKFPMFWHMQLYSGEASAGTDGLSTGNNSVTVNTEIGGYYAYAPSFSGLLSVYKSCWNFPLSLSGVVAKSLKQFDPGYMVKNFITMCVPNKHWFVHLDANNEQFINKWNNHNGYVTQCQDDWQTKYNLGTATGQCPKGS